MSTLSTPPLPGSQPSHHSPHATGKSTSSSATHFNIPIDPVLLPSAPHPSLEFSSTQPLRPPARDTLSSNTSEDESERSDSEEGDSEPSGEEDGGRDMPEVGWATTGQARKVHPGKYVLVETLPPTNNFFITGFAPQTIPVPTPRHHSLPPDHEFTFSRDEDDEAAHGVLTGNGTNVTEVVDTYA